MKPFHPPPSAEPLPFSKMSGAGNDFVIVDNRTGRVTDPVSLARQICTRRLSVGADGLILIETSPRATFRMRYLNSDGSPAGFCGNGTRCAARFAFMNVIAPRRMTIETEAGMVTAEIGDHAEVTLSLPAPRDFQADRPLEVGSMVIRGSSLVVGVPHYVLFLTGDLWSQQIEPIGRAIRFHPRLAPEGANVDFVIVSGRKSVEVRTYERGVEGETLSCGSGVVASVSVAALFGRVDSPVTVLTRSGTSLEVGFEKTGGALDGVRLKGDARLVYRAALTPETLDGFDPEFIRSPTSPVGVP